MPLILKIDADNKQAVAKIKEAAKKAGASVKKLEKESVKSAGAMKSAFGSMGKVLAGIGLALVVRGLKNIILETITFRDEIAKFSKATGISVEFLSALGFAAEQSGTSMNTLSTGLGRLARNISDAERISTVREAFELLEVETRNVDGSLKSLESILPEIADGFKGMDDATKKAGLAQELFGRAGLQLIPFLDEGAAGIKALMEEAKRLGIVFGQEAAVEAENAADAINRFSTASTALGQNLSSAVLPKLTAMANNLAAISSNLTSATSKFGKFREALSGFGGLVERELRGVTDAASSGFETGIDAIEEFLELLDSVDAATIKGNLETIRTVTEENLRISREAVVTERIRVDFVELRLNDELRMNVLLAQQRNLLGTIVEKEQEKLSFVEKTVFSMEELQANAIKVRDELLLSNGIIVNTDVILLQSLIKLQQTAALWGEELNPEVEKYLENLRAAGVTLPNLTKESSFIKDNIVGAALAMQSLVDAAKSGKVTLSGILGALSFIPGPQQPFVQAAAIGSRAAGFAHGTNFAPGGRALVGELGPEIVNLPRGSQVIPNNQITNSNNTSSTVFNLSFSGFPADDFQLRKFANKLNGMVQDGEIHMIASEIA